MATTASQPVARKIEEQNTTLPWIVLFAGWLVPGAGHFILGKWVRGTLLFVSILGMFLIGVTCAGEIHVPNTGDILEMLGFAGQLGMGALYFVARIFSLGAISVTTTVADYATKALVIAGLLNIIAAVDAHSLANGRKRSL